jgi:hypothetical protein
MKAIIIVIALCYSLDSLSQVNRYNKPVPVKYKSQYVPKDLSLIKDVLMYKEAQYYNNMKKIDALIEWTYDIRSASNDAAFIRKIDKHYNKLRTFDNEDLSLLTREIRQVELAIKEDVYNYNKAIDNKKKEEANKFRPGSEIKVFNSSHITDRSGNIIYLVPQKSIVYLIEYQGRRMYVKSDGHKGYLSPVFVKKDQH